MNWELAVKVLGIVVGGVISVVQIINRLPKSRTSLKADLEILQLMDDSDPLYTLVKQDIDGRIREIYGGGDRSKRRSGIEWGGAVVSAIVLLSFAGWTAYLLKGGFSWSAIPASLIALLAFFALVGAFVPDETQADDPPPTKENEGVETA